jgi:hypothetical protein
MSRFRGQLHSRSGTGLPFFRPLLQPRFPGRDNGDLGHGEKTIQQY